MLWILALSLPLLAIQDDGNEDERTTAQKEFSSASDAENLARLQLWQAYQAHDAFVKELRDPARGPKLRADLLALSERLARAVVGGEPLADAQQLWTTGAAEYGVGEMVVETIGRRLLLAAIQALRAQPPGDPLAGAADQLDKLLPAEHPFPEVWNRSLVAISPQCKAYQRARKRREKARLKLLESINPVSLHPAYGKEPEGMVLVPGGLYTIGPAKGWATGEAANARTVEVGSFFIDRFEVTNREYRLFLASLPERKAAALYPTTWEKSPEGGVPRIPEGEEEHPVTGIDLVAAMTYAEWRGKSDPQYRNLRIPTEEEWEIAGRGPSALLYTWGDLYSEKSANGYDSGRYAAAAVGSYPADRSPFLCFDMCGNVAEWTVSRTEGKPLKSPPPEGALLNVICRGGSFLTPEPMESTSLTYRWPQPARGTHRSDLGFRCVRDAPER